MDQRIVFLLSRLTCSALLTSAATSSGSIQPGRKRLGLVLRNCSRSRCSSSSIPTTASVLSLRTVESGSGGQALAFENRYLCKDGSYKWLLWNATADIDHHLIYSVARDITERKQAEEERERLLRELQAALAEVKELQAILPICMYCKNIRDDKNYWQSVDSYISHHTHTRFSHGICPACYEKAIQARRKKDSERGLG